MSLRQKEGGVGLFLTWHINSLGRMIIKHCLDDGGWVGDDKMCLKTILGLATAGIEWGPGTRVSIELPTLGGACLRVKEGKRVRRACVESLFKVQGGSPLDTKGNGEQQWQLWT